MNKEVKLGRKPSNKTKRKSNKVIKQSKPKQGTPPKNSARFPKKKNDYFELESDKEPAVEQDAEIEESDSDDAEEDMYEV
ncbi:MAG: hypothetical protein HY587_08385 [Candidatus Omnitrophica bacterium]|nr:hypothetical protein [Candidatus Omnitrophota bacterium]